MMKPCPSDYLQPGRPFTGRHIQAALCLTVLAAVMAVGCSQGDRPPLTEVHGTVTLDGQPLPRATVTFLPVDQGRASRAMTDDAGYYELRYLRDIRGAMMGTHQVIITTASEEVPRELLPARYNEETTLTVEVKPDVERYDFDLTSGGAP